MISLSNTAILILTCNDFEALDITISQVLATTPQEVPIYLLSNCHGMPGAEICEDMCRFTARANYGRVHWLNPMKAQPAFFGIKDAIETEIDADYILKLDDDAFPIAPGWLEALIDTYAAQDPDKIAYVSGLVNNNPYGFYRLTSLPDLRDTYRDMMDQPHLAGEHVPGYQEFRISAPGEVDPGGWGTVWQFPHLARWIHEETTLQPDRFKALVADLGPATFDPKIRYSINVMLFQRDLWAAVATGGTDDEEMLNKYCAKHDKSIIVREDIPFVHLYFGPQKRYLADLLPKVRDTYPSPHPRLIADWTAFKTNWQIELQKKN
ncbi:MAG: glycosyltransferase family A protein [Pseudomonadota bacterium]